MNLFNVLSISTTLYLHVSIVVKEKEKICFINNYFQYLFALITIVFWFSTSLYIRICLPSVHEVEENLPHPFFTDQALETEFFIEKENIL